MRYIAIVLLAISTTVNAQSVEYVQNEDGTYREVKTEVTDSLTDQDVLIRKIDRFERLLSDNKGMIETIVLTSRDTLEVPDSLYNDEGELMRIIRYGLDTISIKDTLILPSYEDDFSQIEIALSEVQRWRDRVDQERVKLKKLRVQRGREVDVIRRLWSTELRSYYNKKYKKK